MQERNRIAGDIACRGHPKRNRRMAEDIQVGHWECEKRGGEEHNLGKPPDFLTRAWTLKPMHQARRVSSTWRVCLIRGCDGQGRGTPPRGALVCCIHVWGLKPILRARRVLGTPRVCCMRLVPCMAPVLWSQFRSIVRCRDSRTQFVESCARCILVIYE